LEYYLVNGEVRRKMTATVNLEDAVSTCCTYIQPVGSEYVHINDAFRRISAEDITSLVDVPSFDRSSMDGYAISYDDLKILNLRESISLQIAGIIQAGSIVPRQIKAGETYRIMTGALVPEGSGAVIKQEEVESYKEQDKIVVRRRHKPNQNISRAGELLRAGDKIAAKGQLLKAEVLEQIATCGIDKIEVHRIPRVAVIDTGSELILPGVPIREGQIYASSRSLLAGKIKEAGAEPLLFDSVVEDDLMAIVQAIEKAVNVVDMVIITGGTGKGLYDLVYNAFEHIQAKTLFRGVNIIPGKFSSAVIYNNKIIFNVSGNPHAAGILFEVLVKPALQKLSGNLLYIQEWFDIVLQCALKKIKPVRNLCLGEIIFENGGIYAQPTGKSGYHYIRNPIILDIQPGQGAAGDMVKALLL
jgi:molybdopterin molybdotransferase